jgi:4-hydroxy-tetrahydrodipicolinate synthase
MKWEGVFPAMTTPFGPDLAIDHGFLADHARWLVENGSRGLVVLGSLGEGATLSTPEKQAIVETVVKSVGDRVPVVAGISALGTSEAADLARMARDSGCRGLMVLPPYVYVGDWREMKAHVAAVLAATPLSCMLYNNPVAYKTDFTPPQIAELAAEHANLHAVKESSADVRRLAAIRELIGDRLALFVGVDDLIVEGIDAGAVGWIAGLVNAFPRESVTLFDLARAGRRDEAWALYRWFLPLLRLDVVPKFVQLIKLVQQEVGMGGERVRPPRLELVGAEREECLRIVKDALRTRPRA